MKHLLFRLIFALAISLSWGHSFAQAYPSKTVKIVVTFPPGGPLDILARNVGAKLQDIWAQPVVVDNRAGGNTVIGAEHVRTSPPDGYTLLMAIDSTLVMNQHLLARMPYDPVKDFTPITHTSNLNLVLATHSDSPYKTMSQLVEAAKRSPGKLNIGAGSVSTQLCAELFKSAAEIDLTYVAYRGSAPVVQAMLAKEVDITCDGLAGTTPHIKNGRLRALAVTGPKRFSGLSDVPTLTEAGVPGMQMVIWTALVGPAGLPAEVVQKLNTDVRKVLAMSDIREKMLTMGIELHGSSPEELGALIRSDGQRWGVPIRRVGIKLD